MIFGKIFSKIFFQNLLTTARKSATAWGCACACYARLFRRVCVRVAWVWVCPLSVSVRPLVGGFGGLVWASVWLSAVRVWVCLVWWCGGVGMRARVFLYGSRNNRKRATAHGLRVSVCLRLRLPSVSVSAVFVRPSNIIFLTLIISPYSRGVFYTKTATEKRRTVCVRSPSLPQTFPRTPTPLTSVDRFGNFPNSGGEFRNGNLGIFS